MSKIQSQMGNEKQIDKQEDELSIICLSILAEQVKQKPIMLQILDQPEKQDLFLKTIENSFTNSKDWHVNRIKQVYDKIRSEVDQISTTVPGQSADSESDGESSEMKTP